MKSTFYFVSNILIIEFLVSNKVAEGQFKNTFNLNIKMIFQILTNINLMQ